MAALLSGKRTIRVAKSSDLAEVAEALEGMEEILFPGTAARRVQTDALRAATPTEGIIAHYQLDVRLPQTMGIWRAAKVVEEQDSGGEKAEELFRWRVLWLVRFIQSAPPWKSALGEQLSSPYQGCEAGSPFWYVHLQTQGLKPAE